MRDVARTILDRLAVTLVWSAAVAIAAAEVRSVFRFVLDYGWAGLGAGFGPVRILTLFWRRTTGWGVFWGMTTGLVTAIVWKQFPALQQQVYNLVPAFLAAIVATVIVSCVTGNNGNPVAE